MVVSDCFCIGLKLAQLVARFSVSKYQAIRRIDIFDTFTAWPKMFLKRKQITFYPTSKSIERTAFCLSLLAQIISLGSADKLHAIKVCAKNMAATWYTCVTVPRKFRNVPGHESSEYLHISAKLSVHQRCQEWTPHSDAYLQTKYWADCQFPHRIVLADDLAGTRQGRS